MKHSISARQVMMGTAGLAVLSALSGCQSSQEEKQNAEAPNKFLVVEQQPNGKYVVIEEMPTTGPSRAIIHETDENGTVHERVMSEAELKAMADQEYKKMQEGKSELNSEPKSEGMGLGGTILAAGGALLGNMIGNALMNNTNFRKNQDASNRSAYHRSANQSGSKASSASSKKSFFGSSGSRSSSSSSSFGG